jgi:hypothetical protein
MNYTYTISTNYSYSLKRKNINRVKQRRLRRLYRVVSLYHVAKYTKTLNKALGN